MQNQGPVPHPDVRIHLSDLPPEKPEKAQKTGYAVRIFRSNARSTSQSAAISTISAEPVVSNCR